MVNQTVPKHLFTATAYKIAPFLLEQDEPVREEHADVPDRDEPNCSQTSIYLNCLPNCFAFLEQDEPVREEHPDVPDRGEPRSLHPGNAHHEKQSQPEGQYYNALQR